MASSIINVLKVLGTGAVVAVLILILVAIALMVPIAGILWWAGIFSMKDVLIVLIIWGSLQSIFGGSQSE